MMLLFYNHKMLINNTMDNTSLFGLTRLKFFWISSKSHRYSYLFLTNVPTSLQSALKMVKCLPTVWETWVPSPCQEDPLEKEMATHSLPGKSHGQRSLVGYSPWGHKESDTTERLHFHFNVRHPLVSALTYSPSKISTILMASVTLHVPESLHHHV